VTFSLTRSASSGLALDIDTPPGYFPVMAKKASKTSASTGSRLPLIIGVTSVLTVAVVALVLTLSNTASGEALTTISVADLRRAQQQGEITLLDVREAWEYEQGHVEGAILMPLIYDTAQQALEAGLDLNEPVYVFCRSGNRSLQASADLVAAGFTDVRNVAGGIIDWNAAGFPLTN